MMWYIYPYWPSLLGSVGLVLSQANFTCQRCYDLIKEKLTVIGMLLSDCHINALFDEFSTYASLDRMARQCNINRKSTKILGKCL